MPVVAASLFAICVLLLGGASRIDSLAQIPVGIVSAAMCGVAIAWVRPGDLRQYQPVLFFMVGFSILVGLQLVPLPPSVWSALPGRSIYLTAANLAVITQPWRPLSISPDLTLASLLGFLTPLAALLAVAIVGFERTRVLLPCFLAIGLASIALGLAQLGGGPDSSLRYYAQTNTEAPVGFFANRNHYGFFLAIMVPMLAIWARGKKPRRDARHAARQQPGLRAILALAYFVVLLSMILLSGSRAAMLLVFALLPPSVLLYRRDRKFRLDRKSVLYATAGLALVVSVVTATVIAARATAIVRLVEADPVGDVRALYVAPSITAMEAFFPFGAGFGTFDPAFRRFEPYEILSRKYANHAHNELLELPIEGGLPAMLLMVVLVGWWAWSSWRIWAPRSPRPGGELARLGSLMTGTLLVSSVVDYPLRTPFFASIFVVAAAWMLADRSYRSSSDRTDRLSGDA